MRETLSRPLDVVDEREPDHQQNDQRDEQQLDPDRDAYKPARLLGPLSALVTVRGVFHQRSVAAVARGLDGHAWSIGRHSPGVPAKPASWGGSPRGSPRSLLRGVGLPGSPRSLLRGVGLPGSPAKPASWGGSPGVPAKPASWGGSPGVPAKPASWGGSPGVPAKPASWGGSPRGSPRSLLRG